MRFSACQHLIFEEFTGECLRRRSNARPSKAINKCQYLTIPYFRSYISVMNVNLGDVLDNFVADLLKTGLYQSQSEVVREGLRLLKEREELKSLRLAELRKEIAIGSEQADRGELVDGEEAFAEIRRRSAGRKRAQG
jgi:antitoxin ParD1/3/4